MKFAVVKRQKRLWIDCVETGEPIYTPPSFVRLQSREQLSVLAGRFTELKARCINAIAEFEARHSTRKLSRK